MERFIEILRRLLLAANWVCFGGAAIISVFGAVTKNNFDLGLLLIGGGSLAIAVSLTFLINWITKKE
jgi:hypothetical protein